VCFGTESPGLLYALTQESHRPGVSDRTMVGNSATTFAYESQGTEWRRHEREHETTGTGKKHRGLVAPRPTSAMNPSGQAAEEKKAKGRSGVVFRSVALIGHREESN
jgi:hypothetical protein